MPDSPVSAKFLPEEDKLLAIERYNRFYTVAFFGFLTNGRLRMNQQGIENHEWKWDHVKEAFLDPKSWVWFSLMISISYVHSTSPISIFLLILA